MFDLPLALDVPAGRSGVASLTGIPTIIRKKSTPFCATVGKIGIPCSKCTVKLKYLSNFHTFRIDAGIALSSFRRKANRDRFGRRFGGANKIGSLVLLSFLGRLLSRRGHEDTMVKLRLMDDSLSRRTLTRGERIRQGTPPMIMRTTLLAGLIAIAIAIGGETRRASAAPFQIGVGGGSFVGLGTPWYNAGWGNNGWDTLGWGNAGWGNNGWDTLSWGNAGWDTQGWGNAGWDTQGWGNTGWDTQGWGTSGWDNSGFGNMGWDAQSWMSQPWEAQGWGNTGFYMPYYYNGGFGFSGY